MDLYVVVMSLPFIPLLRFERNNRTTVTIAIIDATIHMYVHIVINTSNQK